MSIEISSNAVLQKTRLKLFQLQNSFSTIQMILGLKKVQRSNLKILFSNFRMDVENDPRVAFEEDRERENPNQEAGQNILRERERRGRRLRRIERRARRAQRRRLREDVDR